MANNKELSDKNLEAIAGGKEKNEEGFMLEVECVVFGAGPTRRGEKQLMTHWVEMETTIESIETRACESCNASSAGCQTFYNGKLCDKTAMIGELGISPIEKLTIFLRTS